MTDGDLIERISRKLREIFSPLIPRDRAVALIDFPESANCGDHAVWLGEKKLLSALGFNTAYQCSAQSYDRAQMAAKIGNGTILVHGAAGSGARRSLDHEFHLRVLEDFPANKVILLPQQFLEGEGLRQLAKLAAAHGDVVLCARSAAEQQSLSGVGAPVPVELAPDLAFMLGRQQRACDPVYDIVWIGRTDQPRANDQTEQAARLSSQAAEKLVLPRFPDGIEINVVVKHRPPTVLLTDWYSLFLENELARLALRGLDPDARSAAYLGRAIHMLSLGHLAITDRLHGHILCLLLGIPHILVNDDSGANGSFHDTWTREAGLCRMARNPAEAWAQARSAAPKVKEAKAHGAEIWS